MMIVEVGFKLKDNIEYYDKILKENRLENCANCETHDIYYTNISLENMTENEIKSSCVRIRMINSDECKVQNTESFFELKEIKWATNLRAVESQLISKGFEKIFDTIKKDHHYAKEKMKSRIQLQEISDIGLLVYYDNLLYYELPLDEQRNKLIDELNSYGFNFKYEDLGLDKLRTLYYKKEMYSKNQNG